MILRDLYQWALSVRDAGGLTTSWPHRQALATRNAEAAALHASTRRASQAEKYPPIRRAQDVIITVEACDRTSYLVPLLSAPEELQRAMWERLPVVLLCMGCRIRRYASQLKTRRCPRCGHTLQTYPELIGQDEEAAAQRLRQGGVRVG